MSKKATEVSVDEQVLQLIEIVNQKKASISAGERPQWVTHCSFNRDPRSNDASNAKNIQVQTSPDVLIEIYGRLTTYEQMMKVAAADLGISNVSVKWQGFLIKDWVQDIKTRLNQLTLKKQREEVEVLEQRVNQLVTPEQRRQLELKRLQQELLEK